MSLFLSLSFWVLMDNHVHLLLFRGQAGGFDRWRLDPESWRLVKGVIASGQSSGGVPHFKGSLG
jgi:hypothetical protein